MRFRFLSAAAVMLCAAAAAAQISSPTLRCTIPATRPGDFDDLLRPSTPQESVRMRQAPRGVIRAGHRLIVHWSHGTRTFRDKPPFDAPLDGVRWSYCGFSNVFGVHLIGEQNVDVFTGVLLSDKTGAVLPAGEEVSYSPNRLYYLASEQPDGQDGPTLMVYSRNGRLIWKGYTLAEFASVGWNANNQVIMQVALPSGSLQTVTLTEVGTSWQWLPKLAP